MARSLERFWEKLETNFPLGGPRKHLRELLGDEVVKDLEASGLLAQRRVADTYPCPGTGGFNCPRAILRLDDGGYVAVCGNEPAACEELRLGADDVAHLSIGPDDLCSAVAKALQIRGAPEAITGLRHVYRAGMFIPEPGVRHPVYFAARCQRGDYAEVLDALRSRHDDGPFAVMVPTDRFLAEDTSRQMATLGVPLLPLSDVIGSDGAALTALVDPLRYFSAIGGRGAGPTHVADTVVASALVCSGDGDATWRHLDDRAYQELVAAADEYEIFADELKKTVVKGPAGTREPKSSVKPGYFTMIRAAVDSRGYFDPNIDSPDEDQVSGKQIFQRARKVFDIKYDAAGGKATWKLFKSVKVDNRTDYHFNADAGVSFAFIFLPDS